MTHIKQFIRYFLASGCAFIVDFGLLYIFTDIFGVYYITSNILSYTSGTVISYSLNKRYTFSNKYKNKPKQFLLFITISTINLGIAISLLYFFVEYLNIYYLYGKVLSTGIGFLINFVGHKYITFNYLK